MQEWKKARLGDCIKELNERTTENNQYQVLSVTKDGIFSQEEYFKKQIASENNIGYKILRKNNLVFSTMNLWMGSLDVLANYDIGIVSPAYKIFEFNKELMLPQYGNYFMRSYYMIEQYKKCSEQGASIVRRNLDLKALLNSIISIPTIKEQEKIIEVLADISNIIEKNKEILKLVKKQKKETMTLILGNSDTWNQKCFGEIFEIKPNNSLSRDKLNYFGGDFKNIHYGDILVKYKEIVDIKENTNVPYINSNEHNKLNTYMELNDGDIIIADTAEDESVGKAIEIKNSQGEKVVSGLHTIACRPKFKFANGYLGYYINSNEFHKQLIPLMQGIKVLGITKNNITKRTFIRYPDLNIQSKIVNIMECYSKKEILLLNQISKYEKLRYGLMQKLLTGKVRVKI